MGCLEMSLVKTQVHNTCMATLAIVQNSQNFVALDFQFNQFVVIFLFILVLH